ncbi:MAG: hypothetical protein AAF310_06140, partial [Myxococcota bacterium]
MQHFLQKNIAKPLKRRNNFLHSSTYFVTMLSPINNTKRNLMFVQEITSTSVLRLHKQAISCMGAGNIDQAVTCLQKALHVLKHSSEPDSELIISYHLLSKM